jgi:hypothetical protein
MGARWPRAWAPAGYAGSGRRRGLAAGRPAVPAMERYRRKITAPLQGGQGQAIVAGGVASVTVGPTGAGVTWYPTQMTISTTTGIDTGFDTSVCQIYLGPAGTPVTLLTTIFGGNGLVGVALPPLQSGQYVIAQWSAANDGDTAAVNVAGTMDALSV